MQLNPQEKIATEHLGRVCAVSFSNKGNTGRGFTHNIRQSPIRTDYVLVGRLLAYGAGQLVFYDAAFTEHHHNSLYVQGFYVHKTGRASHTVLTSDLFGAPWLNSVEGETDVEKFLGSMNQKDGWAYGAALLPHLQTLK
jgi:hypothetical protein